jgi:hypothetical protein
MAHAGRISAMNHILVPIAAGDIAPARALRTAFAHFWSTSQGGPREVYDRFIAVIEANGAASRCPRSPCSRPGPT